MLTELPLMAYPHCTGQGLAQEQRPETGLMGSNILYRNVHAGQRKEPWSIVSYCTSPVPFTCPGPVPMRCE